MIYKLEDKLNFGKKHQGRKLKNVICGDGDDNISIALYLKSCFNFFSAKTTSFNLWASNLFVDKSCYDSFTKTGVTLNTEYTIFRDIEVENGLIFFFSSSETYKKFSETIIAFLKSDFEPKIILSYDKDYNKALVSECLSIRPDPSYIDWAINNVDYFAISPEIINQTFYCNSLISFEILPFDINKYSDFTSHFNFIGYNDGDIIIKYKPIFRKYEYFFSKETIAINNEKASRLLNSTPKNNLNVYRSSPTNKTSYYQRRGAEINGSWYNEETINEAFNGDPRNIWNID